MFYVFDKLRGSSNNAMTKSLCRCLFALWAASAVPIEAWSQEHRINDDLEVVRLSAHVWQHITTEYSPTFGAYTANGLVYINGGEAVLIDTPPSESQTRALINWFAQNFSGTKWKAVVVDHFHADALGGLNVLHQLGVPSYAHERCPQLLAEKNDRYERPQHVFSKKLVLSVGGGKIVSFYPGEGHTRDNIVCYIKDENILFGGCLVKCLDAGKGNIADANVGAWSATVRKVKRKFKNVRMVVPGHGPAGDGSLLEYTIDLFEQDSTAR